MRRNKSKIRNSFLGFLLGMILISCSESPMYQKSISFENREWPLDVKPQFEVDIVDVTKSYTFKLTLRTTTDYAYNNLWIFLKTTTPKGEVVREPYEIKLADPSGAWFGKKSGSLVTTSLIFANRNLPEAGKYIFEVEQGITASKVDEISDVTFEVDNVK